MSGKVRIGQLIAPFGPGALYTDQRGTSLVVCGLDHWHQQQDLEHNFLDCDHPEEFEIFEPRLSELLSIDRFRKPADFRVVRKGQQPPPNAFIYSPAQRFPCWYRNSRTGQLKKFNLDTQLIEHPQGASWIPVRFVAVCKGGHLCEFPWKEWCKCTCVGEPDLFLIDRGGADLGSIKVECRACNKSKSLAGTTKPSTTEGGESLFKKGKIQCPGDRPWLGKNANEIGCPHDLVGALINQTNIYFPKTLSSIFLPDINLHNESVIQLKTAIEGDDTLCVTAKMLWRMMGMEAAANMVFDQLNNRLVGTFNISNIKIALESLFNPASIVLTGALEPSANESELLAFRRSEFNIIRVTVNNTEHIRDLRVIPSIVPPEMSQWISKVNLVERLRETRAFYGFDRLESNPALLDEMPTAAMNQLFRNPPVNRSDQWLPAIKVFGEGIYIELEEQMIGHWMEKNAEWLLHRLNAAFITRLYGVYQTLPPISGLDIKWAAKYLLVHSFSHILLNQIVFEGGYSTAALRERLYVSSDNNAPMAGILIYTSAGDSEGTLGGLVRLGQPDRLEPVIRKAINRASWCSADPVCSENLGGQGSRLVNLAACHSCMLLPETACETINNGLDRAMIVGTPDNRTPGFMSELLDEIYSLED